MHPVVYAEPGPAPLSSQYASYSLPATINTVAHKSAPPSAVYTTSYVETQPGLGGGPSEQAARMTASHQRVYQTAPVSGHFTSDCGEPEGHTYVYYPDSTGGAVRKFVEPEFVQPLKVPEAGTQSRGKLKGQDMRPRSTISTVKPAPSGTLVSYPHEWQQEIKQLQTMLNTRESQLEDKEAELRDALMKLQELRKQGRPSRQEADKGVDDTAVHHEEVELRTMRTRVELLRRERQELIELLLQKERQAAALDTIDPSAKEASALQLGVQAISMVQGTSELREKLHLAEAEIKTLRAERVAADELQQDTFDKLTDKRREAAELLELVSQRDMKVARIEAYLQQKTRELELLATRAKERLQKEQRKREEVEQEYLVATEQCNAFKASVASRDEKILQLQADVVRRDTLMKQLEERVRVLSEDLTGAHAQLQQMLRGMAAKDAYMQELEAQLRKNDTERQVAYLTEVSKSRKLALDTRIQQDQCRVALNDKQEKLAEAKQDLFRSQMAMERIRKAISSAEESQTCYARSEALQSPVLHRHATAPLEVLPRSLADIPSIPVEQSLRSMEADFLIRQPPSGSSPAGATFKQPPPTTKPPASTSKVPSTTSKPPLSTSVSAPVIALTGSATVPDKYCPPYSAIPGDLVDQAIARLFERPEYRPLSARICRLGPGTYLCCMNEVTMEVDRDGRVVMGPPGGEKILLASYLDVLRSGADPCLKQLEPSTAKASSQSLTKKGE